MKRLFVKGIDTYRTLSRPAKAAIWFTMCYTVQHGIQFIGMPIFTRMMSTEEYGIYTTFMSWFRLLCVITSVNIYSGVFNRAMIRYENDRNAYISSVQGLTSLITLSFAAVILSVYWIFPTFLQTNIKAILLMLVYLFFFPTLQYWAQAQRFHFAYHKLVFVTLLNSIVNLGLGILMVIHAEQKGLALIFSTVAVNSVICLVIYIKLALKGRQFFIKKYWLWSLKLALPLIPSALSGILLGHADRIMIRYMCGSSQAAIYNIVYQISMIMTIVRTGINGAYVPWLYYSLKAKKYADIKSVVNFITLLIASLTFVFILVGPEILKIVAPPEYYEAVIDIPAIMMGCFFTFLYFLFEQVEFYYERVIYNSIVAVLGALMNVILNYVCILQFGYLAGGYTTMISYGFMAVSHYFYLRKVLKEEQEPKELFDFRIIFLLSLFLFSSGLMCLVFYRLSLIVRYGLLLTMLLMAFSHKRKIIHVFRRLKLNGNQGNTK